MPHVSPSFPCSAWERPSGRLAALTRDPASAALAGREHLVEPCFIYNDLIVQRYEPGCVGITPHRDHIAYEGLVSLVILSGEAEFGICADRAGHGGREIASPEGCLLLMRGAGFAGLKTRPFHLLRNVRTRRVSFGLRYDRRKP